MNRCLAFVFALLFASLSVASACTAQAPSWVHFTLEPQRGSNDIRATFNDEGRRHGDNRWSTNFAAPQLVGLDVASFRAAGTKPLRFAIIREAGRLDCSGHGGDAYAAGNCGFTANPAFAQLLATKGIGRPTSEQAFTLMAVDARRELIDAVAAANYPTPTVNNLIELSALEVDGNYIRGLAQAGYRPRSLHTLVEFKALGITPEYIGGFARMGYANIDPDDLVQLKALDITPAYIAGFERAGYRNLPVDKLVQLKALDVTPEFLRAVHPGTDGKLSIDEAVQAKVFDRHN
jgi:hypothetical protein